MEILKKINTFLFLTVFLFTFGTMFLVHAQHTYACTADGACNQGEGDPTTDSDCDYSCYGCTDGNACNYSGSAYVDDGSCDYSCYGCTDGNACNYSGSATVDDGSCDYTSCKGCTELDACNYDSSATQDDGSCNYWTCPDGSCVSDISQCQQRHKTQPTCDPNDPNTYQYCNFYCDSNPDNHIPTPYDACVAANGGGSTCYPSNDACNYDPYCPVDVDPQGLVNCRNATALDPSAICTPDYTACIPQSVPYCDVQGDASYDADGALCNQNINTDYQTCVASEDNPPCSMTFIPYCYAGALSTTPANALAECENSLIVSGNTNDICEPTDAIPPCSLCNGYTVTADYTDNYTDYTGTVNVPSSAYNAEFEPDFCTPPSADLIKSIIQYDVDPIPDQNPPVGPDVSYTPTEVECTNIAPMSYSSFVSHNYSIDSDGNCCPSGDTWDSSSTACVGDQTGAECGSAEGGTLIDTSVTAGQPLSPSSAACSQGTATDVVLAGSTYSWNCNGDSGNDVSCSATRECDPNTEYYCDDGTCRLDSDTTCNNTLSDGSNPNIGGHDGPVNLCPPNETDCLKVFPPIIPSDNTCHIEWGKDSGVFDSYASTTAANPTHCQLSNQDGVLVQDFEPGDSNAPLEYDQPSVKKDTEYTLKCWDGSDNSNPKIATGVCRVNIKQGEFN